MRRLMVEEVFCRSSSKQLAARMLSSGRRRTGATPRRGAGRDDLTGLRVRATSDRFAHASRVGLTPDANLPSEGAAEEAGCGYKITAHVRDGLYPLASALLTKEGLLMPYAQL